MSGFFRKIHRWTLCSFHCGVMITTSITHYCFVPIYVTPLPFEPLIPLLVVVDIDVSLRPLASWDMSLEHDVDLAVRPTLHLRQEKVCHDEAKEPSTGPDIAALAAEVGLLYLGQQLFTARFRRE
jgi:hypothetical protein